MWFEWDVPPQALSVEFTVHVLDDSVIHKNDAGTGGQREREGEGGEKRYEVEAQKWNAQ